MRASVVVSDPDGTAIPVRRCSLGPIDGGEVGHLFGPTGHCIITRSAEDCRLAEVSPGWGSFVGHSGEPRHRPRVMLRAMLRTMTTLLITIDTNIVDPEILEPLGAVLSGIAHEIAFVGVTEREHGFEIGDLGHRISETAVWGESRWSQSIWGGPIPGPFVIGESTLAPDDAAAGRFDVLGDQDDMLECVLAIIGDGSFPRVGDRDNLTDGVRRQLRDAMIFEAHVRGGRHVFVSNDEKAYVSHGKRRKLEQLGRTNIRMLDEFTSLAVAGTTGGLLPR